MQKPALWLGTSLLAVLVPLNLPARGANFTLSDGNGVTVWYVEGSPDNVFIANYYYRLGSTGNENNFLGC